MEGSTCATCPCRSFKGVVLEDHPTLLQPESSCPHPSPDSSGVLPAAEVGSEGIPLELEEEAGAEWEVKDSWPSLALVGLHPLGPHESSWRVLGRVGHQIRLGVLPNMASAHSL